MSKIFYKFKSAKDYDTILFDGTSMSSFDLKREIMLGKKLGDGKGIELEVFDATTNEEFAHDTDMIPRNASVLVKKVPSSGNRDATRYLSGASLVPRGVHMAAGPMLQPSAPTSTQSSTNNAQQSSLSSTAPLADQAARAVIVETIEGSTEEDRIKALFEKAGEKWQQQSAALAASQQQKALAYRQRQNPPPTTQASNTQPAQPQQQSQQQSQQMTMKTLAAAMGTTRPPPANYVCYRCGIPGHWIQFCPTIGDQSFDNVKIKKTTGIPKTFLQTVARNIEKVDPTQMQGLSNLMVTPEGDLVVAQVNDTAFKAHQQNITKLLSFEELVAKAKQFEQEGVVEKGHFVKPELLCAICGLLCRDAVSISCCNAKFCDSCIRNSFNQSQQTSAIQLSLGKCPACKRPSKLDMVHVEKPTRALVDQALRRVAEEIKKREGLGSGVTDSKPLLNLGSFVPGALNSFEMTKKSALTIIDTTDQRPDFIGRSSGDRGDEMVFDMIRMIYVIVKDDDSDHRSRGRSDVHHAVEVHLDMEGGTPEAEVILGLEDIGSVPEVDPVIDADIPAVDPDLDIMIISVDVVVEDN